MSIPQRLFPLLVLTLVAACAKDAPPQSTETTPTPRETSAPAPSAAPVVATPPPAKAPDPAPAPAPADMDAAIRSLMAKAEQPDEKIELQHILIAFQGVPGVRNVTRTKAEAQALAQQVWAEAIAGGDFLTLVKQHTNDSAPGIYPMTKAGRAGMVQAFGDVGFRLKVGEIGVAPWDARASPYGWHIIKRLK